MIFNHLRQSPRDWDDAVPSLCPDCAQPLIARRGEIKRWHWAHKVNVKSKREGGACEGHSETAWHLNWKYAYAGLPGWAVEASITSCAQKYRADAFNEAEGVLYEFVHSLSESYVLKHRYLRASGYTVRWLFDGNHFAAARASSTRDGRGVKRLLKPAARKQYAALRSQWKAPLIHYRGQLWREYKGPKGWTDVYYPVEYPWAQEMLNRYACGAVEPIAENPYVEAE